MWLISNILVYFIAGVVGCAIFAFRSKKFQKLLNPFKAKLILRAIKTLEIKNKKQCQDACLSIKLHCQDLSALGFDCEWITVNGTRRPIALIQLATCHGLCCLFRLNVLKDIPEELQEILSDPKILKLGIASLQDSKLINRDYNVQVCGTLDLRYLYPSSGSLASMAASEIGIHLNKNWHLRCSDWEVAELDSAQIDYAAKDAFVAIEIFKKWLSTKNKTSVTIPYECLLNEYLMDLAKFVDINYSPKTCCNLPVKSAEEKSDWKNNQAESKKKTKSSFLTRKKPLYHNCFMHAPDGELLCSCDKRKAQWYVERELAEVLPGEPYSIRLLFEPAARSGATNGGRFYQHLKQNCCVVCGASDSYLKHNVVPKEYRKHFPSYMKDHQSHDVVLMCIQCHRIASQHNEALRNFLAIRCSAPISVPKVIIDKSIREVKNSAKALLNAGDLIPKERKINLENKIIKHFGVDYINLELLRAAANLESNIISENKETHGLKVVNYFINHEGGIKDLEYLWRTHLLDKMKPQYLPSLWSATHNH